MKSFLCPCEDVTEADLRDAVAEGFDHVETLKRYATPSMGPCQGKMCRALVAELLARSTGQPVPQASRLRPPLAPVTLGALGAEHTAPVRRTPIHHRHLELGARMTDLGEWKRAEVYSSVEEEVGAIRERAGLIDVSTLGKLEVTGRDAVALLEKVYTNRFADLAVGRVRYGVVCDETGIILDDGTFARLAEERWFLTTTSGGVEAMDQWLRWWILRDCPVCPGPTSHARCVHITNVTAALAAVNLAGPRARQVLARLTDLDLSPEAFPYLAVREAAVAGVPALLLRIGFVGELGYEIHCPAEFAVHLWDALLEEGRDLEILPVGLEAQRILRLEKGHLIVGYDTDALSDPIAAGMPWVVKFEKDDFVGRPALMRARAESGPQRLVGFILEEVDSLGARTRDSGSRPHVRRRPLPPLGARTSRPHVRWRPLPPLGARTSPPYAFNTAINEGSQVVVGGRPAGRVTSCRFSPTLGKVIGLAWVPATSAEEGARIAIATPGGIASATVTLRPFYDPEGARARS